MSTARHEAIQAIASTKHQLNRVDFKKTHLKDLFGVNVFNEEVQRQRLPKPVFKALQKTISRAPRSTRHIADAVANAMKDWAIEKGATHFTHLFQPMTGLTAEKHDSFLAPDRRRRRRSPSSAARSWSGASRTPARSPPAASARPSRPAATPPGTRPARPSSSRAPTARRWSSRPPSSAGPARRSTRRRPCSARWRPCRTQATAHPAAVRQQRREEGLHHRRPRAGILPDRQELLLRPARPDQRRPHAVRRQAAQGPGDGGPVLRHHPRARAGVHGRGRGRAVQARRAGQDPPQRGGPEPVRDRPDLRGLQPRAPTTRC